MQRETDPTLWCVNIKGPDDVVAVSSRREAGELAAKFNDFVLLNWESDPNQYDPLLWAVPCQWPHDAESHAHRLGDLGEYGWLRKEGGPSAIATPDLYEARKAVELARHTDAPEDWERATELTDAALSKASPKQEG